MLVISNSTMGKLKNCLSALGTKNSNPKLVTVFVATVVKQFFSLPDVDSTTIQLLAVKAVVNIFKEYYNFI
jgi:hypothetical protein